MPEAVCQTCGKVIRWRNQRGVRLADYRCRQCGGRYRRLPYRECAECEHAQVQVVAGHTFRLRCGDVCQRVVDARRADDARSEG